MSFIKMTTKKSNGGTTPHMMLPLPTATWRYVIECFTMITVLYARIGSPGRRHYLQKFYKNSRLLLNTFLPLTATLELPMQAQISSVPIFFVHLTLVDINITGSPFELGYQFLQSYFFCGSLGYVKIEFDIAIAQKASKYHHEVEKVVKELLKEWLWSHLVMAITNHTDNDCGNPFTGYLNDQYVAAEVGTHAKESYVWFFCCSTLVNNGVSFTAFQKSVLNITFTAV
ncbi:hypothetical protein EDD22DRAFT_847911 [Suillus occidentalis]|nr:hypothetical protein EDD22DRAFT_847911 [Suillus occidentalis]